MATLGFGASIRNFGDKTMEAVKEIRRESIKEVIRYMQVPVRAGGRMRVDTGYLRASLQASTAAMPIIGLNNRPVPTSAYTYDEAAMNAFIDSLDTTTTAFFGYTAAYAIHREYGHNGIPPDAFVRMAAQRWPSIVGTVSSRVFKKYKL